MNRKLHYYVIDRVVDKSSPIRIMAALIISIFTLALNFLAIYLETYHQFSYLMVITLIVTIPLGIFVLPSFILERFLRNSRGLRIRFDKKFDIFEIEQDENIRVFHNNNVRVKQETKDRIEIEIEGQKFLIPKEWSPGNMKTAYYFSDKFFGIPMHSGILSSWTIRTIIQKDRLCLISERA